MPRRDNRTTAGNRARPGLESCRIIHVANSVPKACALLLQCEMEASALNRIVAESKKVGKPAAETRMTGCNNARDRFDVMDLRRPGLLHEIQLQEVGIDHELAGPVRILIGGVLAPKREAPLHTTSNSFECI